MHRCRPYRSADRDACLHLIDQNIPAAFGTNERLDFEAYLATDPSPFFVIEEEAVVACGGVELLGPGQPAEFRWVMVDPAAQGQGLGRVLMLRSLVYVLAETPIRTVAAKTSQHSAAFFARLGLPTTTVAIVPNYWTAGLDLHHLHLHLAADDLPRVREKLWKTNVQMA